MRGIPLLAAAAALALALPPAPVLALDTGKYCKPDAPNVVLYLDVTTPYDDVDRTALTDGVSRVFEGLQGGERVSIRTVEDAFSSSKRLVEVCMPFCPSSGFFADLFSPCTEGVLINDKKAVRAEIVSAVAGRLNAATELPHSEIVRTLSLSAPEEYLKDRPNQFYVFSDMIENSEYLPGTEFFGKGNGTLIEKLSTDHLVPDLWDADVKVFGIGRTGKPGNRQPLPQKELEKLIDFWTKYFAASGAHATLQPNLSAD